VRRGPDLSRIASPSMISQRIVVIEHPTDHIFPILCPPKLRADDASFHVLCRPPLRKASDWNAVNVRSFVTYDALMKFADPRITVSQSYADERRKLIAASNYGVAAALARSVRTVVRGNELTFAMPY